MPTLRQKKVLTKIIENGGNVAEAMRQSGYSEGYIHNSQTLLATKGFQDLLEEFLPDSTLVKVHKEGLAATRIHSSHTEPDREVPDFATRHKYLDTAYKVKNKIKDDSDGPSIKMILRLDI